MAAEPSSSASAKLDELLKGKSTTQEKEPGIPPKNSLGAREHEASGSSAVPSADVMAALAERLQGKAQLNDEETKEDPPNDNNQDEEEAAAPTTSAPIPGPRIVELPSDAEDSNAADEDYEDEISDEEVNDRQADITVPSIFTTRPTIRDKLITQTALVQDDTVNVCLPYLTQGLQPLFRVAHIEFLHFVLGDYPSGFQVMDASRPWMWYWAFAGLTMLGERLDLDSNTRTGIIESATAVQHPAGGFGGGFGQYAHMAPSYAVILSLAIAGDEALDVVDRTTMWQWLGKMKQPNGAFTMAEGGEIDVRGAYCALTLISLLNLPIDLPEGSPARLAGHKTFIDGLGEWIGQCRLLSSINISLLLILYRPNIRRWSGGCTNSRGPWGVHILRASMPLHHGCTARHHTQVS